MTHRINSEDISHLLNTVFLGEIASVQNYGAFVKIPGCRHQGLVHSSQVSSARVDDVSEVLQKGERVWCKVISISEDSKIALSMKVVNQGTGKDLDPNGVQIQQDEQRRKARPTGSQRRAISLEAVLNTTCSKCGVRGHLARDCFKGPADKVYELLPEEEETLPVVAEQQHAEKKHKRKRKEKKHKEKKSKKCKKKASRSLSLDSSSSANDERVTQKRKVSPCSQQQGDSAKRRRSHSRH